MYVSVCVCVCVCVCSYLGKISRTKIHVGSCPHRLLHADGCLGRCGTGMFGCSVSN